MSGNIYMDKHTLRGYTVNPVTYPTCWKAGCCLLQSIIQSLQFRNLYKTLACIGCPPVIFTRCAGHFSSYPCMKSRKGHDHVTSSHDEILNRVPSWYSHSMSIKYHEKRPMKPNGIPISQQLTPRLSMLDAQDFSKRYSGRFTSNFSFCSAFRFCSSWAIFFFLGTALRTM